MPRRRFSQGAVSVLKDILENLEVKDGEEKEEEKDTIDPEEFSALSREEQLKVVFIDISKNLISLLLDFRAKVLGKKHRLQPGQFPGNDRSRRIWSRMHIFQTGSLTGGKKAKWKFQVNSSFLCLLIWILRTRFTGTSTKDDDPRKTPPGAEGGLSVEEILILLNTPVPGCLTNMRLTLRWPSTGTATSTQVKCNRVESGLIDRNTGRKFS